MPLECDGGDNPEGVCKACEAARLASVELFEVIAGYFNNKDFSAQQQIQAISLGALTAVEVAAGNENKVSAAYIVMQIVGGWADRIDTSQTRVLKNKDTVANIIAGNKTLN